MMNIYGLRLRFELKIYESENIEFNNDWLDLGLDFEHNLLFTNHLI